MGWEAWVTLAVVVLVLWALARGLAGADVVLMSGATVLVSLGVVSSAFPGARDLTGSFGNEGVLTVAVLYVTVSLAPIVYPF